MPNGVDAKKGNVWTCKACKVTINTSGLRIEMGDSTEMDNSFLYKKNWKKKGLRQFAKLQDFGGAVIVIVVFTGQ